MSGLQQTYTISLPNRVLCRSSSLPVNGPHELTTGSVEVEGFYVGVELPQHVA